MSPTKPVTGKPVADIVDRSLLDADLMDRNGYAYLIHPLMDGLPRVEPELLQAWVDWAAAQKDLLGAATVLLAPEAMALPLVAPLSLATGLPYIVVRKRKYGLPGEEVAYCETGYGESCLHINDVGPGDKVVLIDDVLSTGGTLRAIIATLQAIGVEVLGALVFLDKGTAREDLAAKTGVTLRAMRKIAVEGRTVHLLD